MALVLQMTMTLDGFVAGSNQTIEEPLGEGGGRIHEWMFASAAWNETHGLQGGESNPDDEIIAEQQRSTGAVLMGRKMLSGGEGPWEDDPNSNG